VPDEFYDTYEGPDELNIWHRLAETALRPHLRPGAVVGEFGCGSGSFLAELRSRYGIEPVGLDYSPRNVDAAAARGIRSVRADFEQTVPVDDEEFDAGLSLEVVEHLVNPRNLVKELHRTLRPGAVACITTPNAFNVRRRVAYLRGYQHDPSMDPANPAFPEHLRGFSFASLRALAESEGMRVEGEWGDRVPAGEYPLAASARALLSSHICLLVRKQPA
jgi:SAM-dependent methyltransferase